MKVGAEPKKLAMLGGLTLLGAYLFYTNVLSQPSGGPPPAPVSRLQRAAENIRAAKDTTPARPVARRLRDSEDFRPSLRIPEGEDRPDPMSIDPTLRLDLLAKVQGVELQGGQRNLFQFSTPPPPPALKTPEPKVQPKTPAQIAQEQAQQKAAAANVKPPPTPINLKYYGYSSVRGEARKKAFFLDGEEILVANEGDLVKKRYRVVRIGVNSVVMEDTESKTEQTLPLQEEVVG